MDNNLCVPVLTGAREYKENLEKQFVRSFSRDSVTKSVSPKLVNFFNFLYSLGGELGGKLKLNLHGESSAGNVSSEFLDNFFKICISLYFYC